MPPEGGTPNEIKEPGSIIVWDTKRQIIWLAAGITFGTFIVYMDAHDEAGRFDRSVFVFWEIILLLIILALFYLYSRKKT
jgi:cell division protein FtsW (lipid II flippase)